MKLHMQSNSISAETVNAFLIKLPGSEFKFWHPKKFCSLKGKGNYLLEIWFGNKDWKIKAQRTGTTFNVLDEFEDTVVAVAAKYNIKYSD